MRMFLSLLIVLLALVLSGCGSAAVAPASSSGSRSGNVVATAMPTPTIEMPANVTLMPGATDINISESAISFVVKSDMQKVIDFYQKELIAKGWKEQEPPSITGIFGRMFFSDPGYQLSMVLNYSEALNQVVVRMSLIHLTVVDSTPTPKP